MYIGELVHSKILFLDAKYMMQSTLLRLHDSVKHGLYN